MQLTDWLTKISLKNPGFGHPSVRTRIACQAAGGPANGAQILKSLKIFRSYLQ
jgi:hypothetical protein